MSRRQEEAVFASVHAWERLEALLTDVRHIWVREARAGVHWLCCDPILHLSHWVLADVGKGDVEMSSVCKCLYWRNQSPSDTPATLLLPILDVCPAAMTAVFVQCFLCAEHSALHSGDCFPWSDSHRTIIFSIPHMGKPRQREVKQLVRWLSHRIMTPAHQGCHRHHHSNSSPIGSPSPLPAAGPKVSVLWNG